MRDFGYRQSGGKRGRTTGYDISIVGAPDRNHSKLRDSLRDFCRRSEFYRPRDGKNTTCMDLTSFGLGCVDTEFLGRGPIASGKKTPVWNH